MFAIFLRAWIDRGWRVHHPVQFETEAGTTVSGGGASLTSALPSGTGFYVYNLARDWKLGVALVPLMGLAGDYSDTWAGRYIIEKEALITYALNPVVSYRIPDWLSIGGGMSVVGAYFSGQTAINNPDPALGDGELKLKSTTVSFGGNVGVLVEPVSGTRLGVTYRSPVNLHFNDIIDEVKNLGPGLNLIIDVLGRRFDVPRGRKVDITLTNPQEMMFSVGPRPDNDSGREQSSGQRHDQRDDDGGVGGDPQSVHRRYRDQGFRTRLRIAAGNVPNFIDLATGDYGPTISDALNSAQTPTMANFATLANVLAGCVTRVKADACSRVFAAAKGPTRERTDRHARGRRICRPLSRVPAGADVRTARPFLSVPEEQ